MRSDSEDLRKIPKVTTNSGKRSYLALRDWTSLDIDIRDASTVSQFKNVHLNMTFPKLAKANVLTSQ
jgi:hypothetical protein